MNIEDINSRMGDLTQELLKQFQIEFIRLAEEEEGLLGFMHEIAENPEMYFSMFGPKIVHLATAYNEALNSYMSLDAVINDGWGEYSPSPEEQELGEAHPSLSPGVITFPTEAVVDPFGSPDESQ